MADEVVGHAFSHGFHSNHTERLSSYWAEALGGPKTFSVAFGDETSVVRMHSGNGAHPEMDRRAIACFDQALIDVGIEAQSKLAQALHDYFAWATDTTLSRYTESADDVPDGLNIPKWSWDGLVKRPIPSQWPIEYPFGTQGPDLTAAVGRVRRRRLTPLPRVGSGPLRKPDR